MAANANLRGDRKGLPTEDFGIPTGGEGVLCADWATASRGDLLLLRKAIRQKWAVPPGRRRPLMEATVWTALRSDTSSLRLRVDAARVALAGRDRDRQLEAAAQRKIPIEGCLGIPSKGWVSLPRSGVWGSESSNTTVGYSFDPDLSVLSLNYT